MKKSKYVFKTNVIYGLLVLVPAAIIFLLLVKIVETSQSRVDHWCHRRHYVRYFAIAFTLFRYWVVCENTDRFLAP